jgi:hypothetical protein
MDVYPYGRSVAKLRPSVLVHCNTRTNRFITSDARPTNCPLAVPISAVTTFMVAVCKSGMMEAKVTCSVDGKRNTFRYCSPLAVKSMSLKGKRKKVGRSMTDFK